jgi:hypothetical protein
VQIYDTKYPSNLLHPYNLIYFNQLISPIYPHMYLFFIYIFTVEKHSIDTDTHTRMSTHPYEYTHVHSTPMSTSKRLG